jgi:hypothetical protein
MYKNAIRCKLEDISRDFRFCVGTNVFEHTSVINIKTFRKCIVSDKASVDDYLQAVNHILLSRIWGQICSQQHCCVIVQS